jgi:hypothetical protein
LADDDRTCADDKDGGDVSAFRHRKSREAARPGRCPAIRLPAGRKIAALIEETPPRARRAPIGRPGTDERTEERIIRRQSSVL